MLKEARRKRAELEESQRCRVSFEAGDMRQWRSPTPFDLVIAPCSSLSHLLTLEDQIAAWRCAFDNLTSGGRFVADLTMPNLAAFAESMQTPPRQVLEIDVDARDPVTGTGCSATRRPDTSRTSSAPKSGSCTTDFLIQTTSTDM